jgi:hypothetical protein
MLVVTQTDNIKALADRNAGLIYRGFMPRFLFVLPESNVGNRDRRALLRGNGISQATTAVFTESLVELAQCLDTLEGGTMELTFDDDAREALGDVMQEIEERKAKGGDLHDLPEVAGKADIQLLKLIGINWAMWSTTTGDRTPTLTASMVKAAYRQFDYFYDQQVRLYTYLETKPVELILGKIQQWCADNRGTTISRRELKRQMDRGASIKIFKEALDLAQEEGDLRAWKDSDTGGAPSWKVTAL